MLRRTALLLGPISAVSWGQGGGKRGPRWFQAPDRSCYDRGTMASKLLEDAIAVARQLPDEEQDVAADAMVSAIQQDGASGYRLTPEQVAEVCRIRSALETGRTRRSTDEEMEALWREFGLRGCATRSRRASRSRSIGRFIAQDKPSAAQAVVRRLRQRRSDARMRSGKATCRGRARARTDLNRAWLDVRCSSRRRTSGAGRIDWKPRHGEISRV